MSALHHKFDTERIMFKQLAFWLTKLMSALDSFKSDVERVTNELDGCILERQTSFAHEADDLVKAGEMHKMGGSEWDG